MKNTGVVVVDVQGDFTTIKNGSLAVDQTNQAYLDAVDKVTRDFKAKGFRIFATQDWHPDNHISFYTNTPGGKPFETIDVDGRTQILWPPHCVQNTPNADLLLDSNLFDAIVRKGMDERFDSYSGFQDDGGAQTQLHQVLQDQQIDRLIVYGLATDFCVKATVLDAVKKGYSVLVIDQLCRGVAQDSTKEAIKEMKRQGALITAECDPDKVESLLE